MMDWKIARWAQIKRLEVTQLNDLQTSEKRFAELNKDNPKYRNRDSFGIGEIAGTWFLNEINIKLGPFWPPRTPEEHREREMRRFDQAIFKLWRPLERKRMDCKISQMEFIHRADVLIFGDSFEFRKYAAVSGGVASKWAKRDEPKSERGCPND